MKNTILICCLSLVFAMGVVALFVAFDQNTDQVSRFQDEANRLEGVNATLGNLLDSHKKSITALHDEVTSQNHLIDALKANADAQRKMIDMLERIVAAYKQGEQMWTGVCGTLYCVNGKCAVPPQCLQ